VAHRDFTTTSANTRNRRRMLNEFETCLM
jgi:hypothetical protein